MGRLQQASLSLVNMSTKLWFTMAHLAVLRANSCSQMIIHSCRQEARQKQVSNYSNSI